MAKRKSQVRKKSVKKSKSRNNRGKIRNPKTGRYVKKSGVIGKKLLAKSRKKKKAIKKSKSRRRKSTKKRRSRRRRQITKGASSGDECWNECRNAFDYNKGYIYYINEENKPAVAGSMNDDKAKTEIKKILKNNYNHISDEEKKREHCYDTCHEWHRAEDLDPTDS